MEMERRTIIEFLRAANPEMAAELNGMSLMDLIDELIDYASETELDYSILSTAFASRVHPDRFDQFHDAVMNQYETIGDGEEIPEPVLDRIASQYR
jgi:hypothetical protein